jgi:hypothetical protein
MDEDPLGPARGIAFGCLIGTIIWALVVWGWVLGV